MAICVPREPEIDAVTWVPLARRRRAERGFDQAKALAIVVGAQTHLPVRRLLRRAVATGPQAKRDASARLEAMRGSFVPASGVRPPGHVLLVDDVLTTGATAGACAEALLANGTVRVSVLVAARALLRVVRPAYTRAGPRPGRWLPGDDRRESTPAAGVTTHVRRPVVAVHGAG
jgi:predicted amidophosphoribosyltransferase